MPGPCRYERARAAGLGWAAGAVRLSLLVGVACGCAGSAHEIVQDSFDIPETAAAPDITAVDDVGAADVPLEGTLALEPSDGVAVVGETLWIHGRSFGRQPTVLVGGRPAAVLGRTRDGGIAVRVPPGTPAGTQPVTVSNDAGKGEHAIAVRRYAAVLAAGSGVLGFAAIGDDGLSAARTTPAGNGRWLAMSADGRAAYVAEGGAAVVDVFEIPASGGPRIVYRLQIGGAPVVALAAAASAPVLAVVRRDDVMLVDTSSPLHPARSTPRALPAGVRAGRIVAADISPDGRLLAVATEADNQVMLLDLAPRGQAPVIGAVTVPAEPGVSTLVDAAFSPAGDTVWILSGDTPRSRAVGPQPTELRAVRVGADPGARGRLAIARTVRIEGATHPVRLAVGRARPLASGASIRLPPERATVFVTAIDGPPASGRAAPAGTAVFRVGAEDAATIALASGERLGLPDVTFNGRWLLAPAAAAGGAVQIAAAIVDGRPVSAGAVQGAVVIPAMTGELPPAARPPAELRVQP